jgi:hypothetical protein
MKDAGPAATTVASHAAKTHLDTIDNLDTSARVNLRNVSSVNPAIHINGLLCVLFVCRKVRRSEKPTKWNGLPL